MNGTEAANCANKPMMTTKIPEITCILSITTPLLTETKSQSNEKKSRDVEKYQGGLGPILYLRLCIEKSVASYSRQDLEVSLTRARLLQNRFSSGESVL